MPTYFSEILKREQELALVYTPAAYRMKLATYFALDRRLAQIAAKTTEPMLGQMRLAWWREMLGKPDTERPNGDEVLDAVGTHWGGQEEELVPLVNAWELLIVEDDMSEPLIREYAEGRAKPFTALSDSVDSEMVERIHHAGALWVLADTATHLSSADERARFAGVARSFDTRAILPRSNRGLAILRGLAVKALANGGKPLMTGRGSALLALRIGLLGR